MTVLPKYVPRTSDPLDHELAARLNAWSQEVGVDSRKSLRPALIKLACWVGVAATVAGATIVWLV